MMTPRSASSKKSPPKIPFCCSSKGLRCPERGDAAVLQSCDRKCSHLFYICVGRQLHRSAEEAAGQSFVLRLKNHQLQIHPHLRHLRNPHSAQRSKNTTGPCQPPLKTPSPQEKDSGPSKLRLPVSSTVLTAEPSSY